MEIVDKLEQERKAELPINITLSGIVMVDKLEDSNAKNPIPVSLLGMVMVDKLEQDRIAELPRLVTLLEMEIKDKLVYSHSGSERDGNGGYLEQERNAEAPILVTLLKMMMVDKLEQESKASFSSFVQLLVQ